MSNCLNVPRQWLLCLNYWLPDCNALREGIKSKADSISHNLERKSFFQTINHKLKFRGNKMELSNFFAPRKSAPGFSLKSNCMLTVDAITDMHVAKNRKKNCGIVWQNTLSSYGNKKNGKKLVFHRISDNTNDPNES